MLTSISSFLFRIKREVPVSCSYEAGGLFVGGLPLSFYHKRQEVVSIRGTGKQISIPLSTAQEGVVSQVLNQIYPKRTCFGGCESDM